MKIAFISMGPSSPLSIGLLSSVIKKAGHDVRLFYDPALFNDSHLFKLPQLSRFFDVKPTIINDVMDYQPDLIAFSVMTNTYRWSLEMAKAIKDKYPKPVIFGGIHPTSVPELVIKEKCVDMVNIGEGVQSFPELISCLENENDYYETKNIWFKTDNTIIRNEVRPFFRYPDTLPFCDFSLFENIFDLKYYSVITAPLGCPYHCSFCSTTVLKKIYEGAPHLRRSPGNVIAELLMAKKRYAIRTVNFDDDVFTLDRKWLETFLFKYKREINLPFKIITHIRNIDERLMMELKNAGCNKIEFGIQSLNEKIRQNVLKRPEKNDEIKKKLMACEKLKIPYQVDHIFDIPGEEEDDYLEAARIYAGFKPARISTFWLVYFPKTEIVQIAKEKKCITDRDIERFEKGFIDPYHVEKSGTSKHHLQQKTYFMFLIMPLLPKRVNWFLVEKKLFLKFPPVPFPVKLVVELLNALKMRDYRKAGNFFRYLKYLKQSLLEKVSSTKTRL